MKLFNSIKVFGQKKIEQAKAFAKKHPVATKVVGTVVAVGGTAAIGYGIYSAVRNDDADDSFTVTTETNEMNMIGSNEDTVEDEYDWKERANEESSRVWKADKDDWQKVIDVANTLEDVGNDGSSGYFIYGNGDKDNPSIEIARVIDGDFYYHYDEPKPEETPEPEEPTIEEAE